MMKSRQLYFALLGLIALAIAGGGFGLYTINNTLANTVQELSKRKEDIAIATQEVASLDSLEKELESIENVKPEIDSALPKSKTQSEAVAQIVAIGAANGVGFDSIQFEKTEGLPAENTQTKPSTLVPEVSTVPITLETGTVPYEALKNFLRGVFEIRRNANVNTLVITKAEGEDIPPGFVNARIIIDIHLEKVATPLTEEEKAQRKKELEEQAKE